MSAVIAEPAAEDAPVLRRPRKKLIVIGAAVLVVALTLAGGTVVWLKQRAARAVAAASDDDGATTEHAAAAHADPKMVPIYLPLDPFVVNLADRDTDRYAQIGITLELDSGVAADQIKAYMPAIRNAILLILANKTSRELLNREGKEQLADEIMREAVRPMGIEIAAPEPMAVATAPASSAAASGAGGAASGAEAAAIPKAKPARRLPSQRNPIQHVHFASFIIQ